MESNKLQTVDVTKTGDTIVANKIINSNVDSSFFKKIKSDKNADEIIDIVWAIPEVKERANYIENKTKGARHLRVEIIETPKENNKYYLVRVGEINDIAFVTHFNFFVYPDNFEIKYYDTVNDTTLSLSSWRKQNINKQK